MVVEVLRQPPALQVQAPRNKGHFSSSDDIIYSGNEAACVFYHWIFIIFIIIIYFRKKCTVCNIFICREHAGIT